MFVITFNYIFVIKIIFINLPHHGTQHSSFTTRNTDNLWQVLKFMLLEILLEILETVIQIKILFKN